MFCVKRGLVASIVVKPQVHDAEYGETLSVMNVPNGDFVSAGLAYILFRTCLELVD